MGFLDAKERVLDVVLTDKGRELLSQNLLDFEFYAFSDDGVDYAGALTASLQVSGSVDDYIRRTLIIEAGQFKDSKEQRDMNTFLYTIPSRRRTLPQLVTNFDDTPDITLRRSYIIDKLILSAKRQKKKVENPIAVIARGTTAAPDAKERLEQYVTEQKARQTEQEILAGKNVVGRTIGLNRVMLDARRVLNTQDGTVQSLSSYFRTKNQQSDVNVLTISRNLEVVTGLSRGVINLQLKSSEGETPSPGGYLIEVYESGSDGKVVKLFEESVVDVLEDKVLKKGFSSDMFLDVDVTSAEIISEEQRIARREQARREEEFRRLQKELRRRVLK
jgi:hypothetical protein